MNLQEWDEMSAAGLTDERAAGLIGHALGFYVGHFILSGVTIGLEELAAEVVREYRPIILRSKDVTMAAAWNGGIESGYAKVKHADAYHRLAKKLNAYVDPNKDFDFA